MKGLSSDSEYVHPRKNIKGPNAIATTRGSNSLQLLGDGGNMQSQTTAADGKGRCMARLCCMKSKKAGAHG